MWVLDSLDEYLIPETLQDQFRVLFQSRRNHHLDYPVPRINGPQYPKPLIGLQDELHVGNITGLNLEIPASGVHSPSTQRLRPYQDPMDVSEENHILYGAL